MPLPPGFKQGRAWCHPAKGTWHPVCTHSHRSGSHSWCQFSCFVNSDHKASGTVRARPLGPTVDTSNACLCSAPPNWLAGTVRSTLPVKGCPAQSCLLPVPLVMSPQPASSTNSPHLTPRNRLTKDPSREGWPWSGPRRDGKMGPCYGVDNPCPTGYEIPSWG